MSDYQDSEILNGRFKQWLQNLGETSRSRLLPVECSGDLRLYASAAHKMTNNLVRRLSFPVGSQAEQSSSCRPNTDNSSGEVTEDVATETAVQSVNFTGYKIPVDEVSRVDAQTQTGSSLEAAKQDFDHASAAAAAEDNSLPDIVYSSTSSSGHSQATSPDVLSGGPFQVDTRCIDPLSVEQNEGQSSSPPESQSPETRSAKKCMMSSGYTTQGSEMSEVSMTGSYDDNIFSPFNDKEPAKLWRMQQSSSLISGEFPSSETVLTVCGKDEEERIEVGGHQINRNKNDREDNLSTEAISASSSAGRLHFEWRDKRGYGQLKEQLKDLALQMIRRGEGVSYVKSQLLERLNSLASESQKQEAGTMQDETDDMELQWIRSLQMAASCGNKNCAVADCRSFQGLLINIETDLRNHSLLNSVGLHREILLSVAKHSRFCCEIHCPVPWCFFFNCCDFEYLDEQLSRLMSHYRSIDFGITRKIIDPEDSDAEFLQFDSDVSWPSVDDGRNQVPTSGLDFEVLAPAGEFGQIAYYAQTTTILPKLLFIRMHSTLDGIHAWTRLRPLQHPHLVTLLWVYIFCKRVVVCSEVMTFGVKSLKDVLKENENVLPMKTMQRYMVDVISAAEFLNENGILYLLWTVDSIGVTSDDETVRLRDFSCAVDESRLQKDKDSVSVVCSALPPIIIPPEMFANDIGRFSEIWGLGCLLFHLTTGSCVNRHLLHEDNDFVQREVKRFCTASSLKILNNDVVIRSILRRVFVEKSQRLDSGELKYRLITAADTRCTGRR